MAKKGRGRGRGRPELVATAAAEYGVNIPKQEDTERYLSPNEIGKIMNLTGEAVKQWIYHRRLPAVKLVNGYWKVRVSDLEKFLKERQQCGKRKVLITETGAMSEVVQAVKDLGHEPVLAHGFADALLKSLNFYPALFLIDLSENDSWKLVEKIRATKAIKKIPVILFAESELKDSDSDLAMKLSVQAFIKRPSDKDSIAKEITLALS